MRSKLLARILPLLVLAGLAGTAVARDLPRLPAFSVPLAAEATEEAPPGLLDPKIESVIWVLVIFLVMSSILYKTAWKNVLAGLKGREERIRNDIAQAEAARLKAEASLKDYNAQLAKAEGRAQEILAQATKDALVLADKIRSDADKAATERSERAARDIEAASKQALREVYTQAANLSTSIAEKILRRSLNANDQQDLVAQSLEQVETVNRG